MAEKRKIFTIYEDGVLGSVRISDEVVAIIASLAATEVEGIASIREGLTGEQITKSGMRSLAKSVNVSVEEGSLVIRIVLNMKYGYSIPATTRQVQEKVRDTIENMTGLTVQAVHVSIAEVDIQKEKKAK